MTVATVPAEMIIKQAEVRAQLVCARLLGITDAPSGHPIECLFLRHSRKRYQSRVPKDFLTYRPYTRRSNSRPRRSVSPREAVAYHALYYLGYSINQIARAFGRSPSVVWRRIARYVRWGLVRRRGYGPQDLRKLPASTRRLAARRRWRELLRWLPLWLAFIEGEVDEPP